MKNQFHGNTSPFRRVLRSAPALNKANELNSLRLENNRYRSLIDNAALGFLTINTSGKILESNPAGARLLGKSCQQVCRSRLHRFLPVEDHKELTQQLQRALDGHPTSLRTSLNRNGKFVSVMLYLTPEGVQRTTDKLCQITIIDLSEHQAAEDNLRIARDGLQHIANHDSLTRLPNRTGFNDRLTSAIGRSRVQGNRFALLLLNLDCFRHVNDPLGHDIGDKLLREVAERLRVTVDEGTSIGRIGGDEFAIILEDVSGYERIAQLARQVSSAVSEPFDSGDHRIGPAASIGVSMYPDHTRDETELMRFASAAMRQAKNSGRNRVRFFTPGLNTTLRERFEIEHDLCDAMKNGDFELYFQPQYDIGTREIVSYEALLRWNHPAQGLLAPDSFIDIVEETGMIESLGDWIITEACQRLTMLRKQGNPARRISVNVSARQFACGTLCDKIEDILKRTQTPAHALELELTESALFDDLPNSVDILNRLRKSGVDIAIDDFGTGYSSFSRLQKLPASRIKIDKSFVHNIPQNHSNKSIVQAMISLAHDLNIEVVAEGVEHHQQALFLSKIGCDYLQGYYVGKPVPFARVVSSARLKTVETA